MFKSIHLYVAGISGAAAAALVTIEWTSLAHLPMLSVTTLLMLILIGLVSQRFATSYSGSDGGSHSVVFIPLLASVLLFGPAAPVVFIGITGAIAETLWKRNGLLKAIFNTAQLTLAASIAGLMYAALDGEAAAIGGVGPSFSFHLNFLAFFVFTVTLLGLNYAFVSGAISISSGTSFRQVFRKMLGRSGVNAFYDVMLSPIAIVVAFLGAELGPLGLLVAVFPLWALRHAYQTSYRLQQANRDLLEALVKAIETRDPYTSGHSRRVQDLARRIVDELSLPGRQSESIVQAALLHDVGKIDAVYDAILKKPDHLDEGERAVIESHVAKGVELLTSLSTVPDDVIAAVRHHHEREDGRGYPEGLRGYEIPLGAKIIKVADAIDAMLSDRPYRKALPVDSVRDQLLKHRGAQFDADLVDRIIRSDLLEDHARTVLATIPNGRAEARDSQDLSRRTLQAFGS